MTNDVDINITPLTARSAADEPVEIVERKGIGHPDTMCDALAEALSRALSAFYLERFGTILHHNVDKVLLAAGASRPAFGGGEVLAPIEIYLAGRAITEFKGVVVPLEALAVETSRLWLREHLHALDAERHVRIHTLIRPGSSDLQDLFMRTGDALANDTSIGVGYAPFDTLERVVLAVEQHLNARTTKADHPVIGEDIKVMGARIGDAVRLTVACAFVGRHLGSLEDYCAARTLLSDLALAAAREVTTMPVEVEVNAADGATPDSVYLTVTGTSAEAGDDGQVGRGNRVNGLITPDRPMSLEAAAGKNPVTHVGKLYNFAAHLLTRALVAEVPGIEEAHCFLLSEIGRPIKEPKVADIRLRLAPGAALDALRSRVEAVVRSELNGVDSLWRRAVAGGLELW